MTLSTNEAAAAIGVHPGRIRALIEAGKLKACDVSTGGKYPRWRIPQASIDAFLNGDSAATTAVERATKRQRIDAAVKKVF